MESDKQADRDRDKYKMRVREILKSKESKKTERERDRESGRKFERVTERGDKQRARGDNLPDQIFTFMFE